MPHVLVRHTPLVVGNNTLQVVLRGQVTKEIVHEIKEAISALRESDLELVRLPLLRVERGFWVFAGTCRSIHHASVLQECFYKPLAKLGWTSLVEIKKSQERFNHIAGLLSTAKTAAAAEKFASLLPDPPIVSEDVARNLLDVVEPLKGFQSDYFFKAEETEPVYRPFTGVVFGGGGTIVEPNPMGSFDILANSIVPLGARDTLVLGCGWDYDITPVQEMIGGQGKIDLDLSVFQLNRYGEVMEPPITPKSLKESSGISMWNDNKTGTGDHFDDERVAIQFSKLHPNVKSLVITISIASGPLNFKLIQNIYLRMLDAEHGVREIELWRYNLDATLAQEHHGTVALCRISNEDGLGWKAETLGHYFRPRQVDRIQVQPKDILTHINDEPVKPCTWVGTNTFGFNMQTLQKSLIFNVTKLTFKRPVVFEDASVAHLRSKNLDFVGQSFSITFDPDGDSNCGIKFEENGSSVVVRACNKRNYNPKPESGYIGPLGILNPLPRPVKIRISNIAANIPATDRGGTTDAYLLIGYKTPKASAVSSMLSVSSYDRVNIAETKPAKVKCPTQLTFPEIVVEVPLFSTTGDVPRCNIELMDRDAMSKDDVVFSHTITITYRFTESPKERFLVTPDFVADVEDLKENRGFSKQDVMLAFDAELIYE